MRARLLVPALAAALTLTMAPAALADVPDHFGSDWDNPVTADPPIIKPDTDSCTVRIMANQFDDYDIHTSDYTPPADCAGDWSAVVLTLHGSVAGVQFDRLGWITISDVPVMKFSTPEPSRDGIEWTVERDVTEFAALLRDPQQVQMYLGNTVNETYTGILDVTVDLTFYTTSDEWPAASTPETVQPLADATTADGATTGTLTVPANTERLIAQVYATGSGGGCEEFWYSAAPASSPDDYWCKTDQGPWREVEVYVDGQLAGIAMPYPHIYTGGWSNPYLWTTLPAPRAFDLLPVQIDLTPFVGTLTDGEPHTISTTVVGAQGEGWSVPTAYLSWQDENVERVTGAVTAVTETAPVVTNTIGTDSDERGDFFTADLDASHSLQVQGYLVTSQGRVAVTTTRSTGTTTHHWWSDGETIDGQVSSFTDTGSVRTQVGHGVPTFERWDYSYGLDGEISIAETGDLTTTMTLTDDGDRGTRRGSRVVDAESWTNVFTGTATWNYTVPRDQRRPTATTEQDFRHTWSDRPDYHRIISTQNGFIVSDV